MHARKWTKAIAACLAVLVLWLGGAGPMRAGSPKTFVVRVERGEQEGDVIAGNVYVNGVLIGKCYENPDKMIPAGSYKGFVRTTSGHNHVVNGKGVLGKSGDFLLELANVPGRTHIQFHAGNKASHSQGCILLGPATRQRGTPMAPSTLRALRAKYYDGKTKWAKIQVIVEDP